MWPAVGTVPYNYLHGYIAFGTSTKSSIGNSLTLQEVLDRARTSNFGVVVEEVRVNVRYDDVFQEPASHNSPLFVLPSDIR